MDESDPRTSQRFFCRTGDKVEGPFDLIELAGLLRESAIDGNTPIREEAAETWRPLQECPEYHSLQEISIDVIARHVVGKERAQSLTQASGKASFPMGWVFAVGLLALVGLAVVWPKPQVQSQSTSSVPVPEASLPWPETRAEHFSIKCPVILEKQATSQPRVVSYRGFDGENAFGVFTQYLPGYTDAEYEQVIGEMKQDLPSKFYRALADNPSMRLYADTTMRVTSERDVYGDGFIGRELCFETTTHSVRLTSRMRFVFGKGSIAALFVVSKNDNFSPEDMERVLSSLEFR